MTVTVNALERIGENHLAPSFIAGGLFHMFTCTYITTANGIMLKKLVCVKQQIISMVLVLKGFLPFFTLSLAHVHYVNSSDSKYL